MSGFNPNFSWLLMEIKNCHGGMDRDTGRAEENILMCGCESMDL